MKAIRFVPGLACLLIVTFSWGALSGAQNTPLPVYSLESDSIAAGKGLEVSKACGFFATADDRVGDACTGLNRVATPQLGRSMSQALSSLALNDKVIGRPYELRLVYAELKPAIVPIPIQAPNLVAIWLKSPAGIDDLIYPLMPGSFNARPNVLYPVDEYLTKLRPALQNIQWSSDYALHAYFNRQFLVSRGRGMNRMYDDPMQLEDSMRLRITWADTYKLGSVELIGVAMHEPPVAFTASAHPISSQFLEPRALTSFEERALVELNAGETASVHTDKTGRFVVGALRAKEDCLQCHKSHKVGDLLGALTYRLKPVKDQMISRVAASLKR